VKFVVSLEWLQIIQSVQRLSKSSTRMISVQRKLQIVNTLTNLGWNTSQDLQEVDMGIQAYIKTKDLLSSGCKLTSSFETYDDIEGEEPFISYYTKIEFPNGDCWSIHGNAEEDETLWTDFNEWGNNRPFLKPRFEALNIEWVEG
jgi:hypothetical protein